MAVLYIKRTATDNKYMKIFKKLKVYNEQEIEDSVFGFGFLKSMNYKTERYGHLFLLSINIKVIKFIKKLFIPL